jgi:uncharacterized membrane protein YkvA (DUF1232 family)
LEPLTAISLAAMHLAIVLLAAIVGIYLPAVVALAIAGRREHARALAGFVPDCAILFSRLARDPCVPRRRGFLLVLMVLYLSSPVDLIPDFFPVVGLVDDAILVAIVLRLVTRECSRTTLETLWPGPLSSLGIVLKLARAPT